MIADCLSGEGAARTHLLHPTPHKPDPAFAEDLRHPSRTISGSEYAAVKHSCAACMTDEGREDVDQYLEVGSSLGRIAGRLVRAGEGLAPGHQIRPCPSSLNTATQTRSMASAFRDGVMRLPRISVIAGNLVEVGAEPPCGDHVPRRVEFNKEPVFARTVALLLQEALTFGSVDLALRAWLGVQDEADKPHLEMALRQFVELTALECPGHAAVSPTVGPREV